MTACVVQDSWTDALDGGHRQQQSAVCPMAQSSVRPTGAMHSCDSDYVAECEVYKNHALQPQYNTRHDLVAMFVYMISMHVVLGHQCLLDATRLSLVTNMKAAHKHNLCVLLQAGLLHKHARRVQSIKIGVMLHCTVYRVTCHGHNTRHM